jgi:hypothetical protein
LPKRLRIGVRYGKIGKVEKCLKINKKRLVGTGFKIAVSWWTKLLLKLFLFLKLLKLVKKLLVKASKLLKK